jgi:clan AA aspartic protease
VIPGVFNEYDEAVVDLVVRGPAGQERLEFIVDTGFDGELTLHPALAAALELPDEGGQRVILADGSEVTFPIRRASVEWNGTARDVMVGLSETVALLAIGLLKGHELRIQCIPNGRVDISELAGSPLPRV